MLTIPELHCSLPHPPPHPPPHTHTHAYPYTHHQEKYSMKERTMLLVFLVHSFNSLVSTGRHTPHLTHHTHNTHTHHTPHTHHRRWMLFESKFSD